MAKSKVPWLLPGDPTDDLHAVPRRFVLARAVPPGGGAGQVLVKNSGTDNDVSWANVATGGGGGGISALRAASDYDDSVAPSDGQSIVWSGSAGKYRPLALTASLVGADPSGTGAAQRTAHEAAGDPHGQYHTDARGDVRYAALNHGHAAGDITSGTLAIARIPVGTASGTVAAGDDSRLSNARTPTLHASTHGSGGSDPITPGAIGAALATHAHSGADITSGTVAYARLPVGTAASTVAAGDDSRLSNARTPTAHVHAASDITSGVLDIARVPTGTTGTTVALGNDSRFSDARTPTAHVHSGADITTGTVGYARLPVGTAASTVAAGDDARLSNARTPTAHVHDAGDVTTGTLAIARIPTGTSGTTVALGNDSRFTDARTPTAHVHAGADITSGTINYARLPVGTAASTIAAGDDARLSNARTPIAHAASHLPGGGDALSALVPPGGSAGQFLRKSSSTDYSMAWADVPGGLGGIVDCSAMTTAAQINAASLAAGDGSIIWLGRRPPSAPLVLDDTIIMRPRQKILGAGGRAQLTCLQAGAGFAAGKPMVAAAGYLNNGTSADNPVSVVGVFLDVNAKTGSHGLVVYNYWSHFEDVQVANCAGAGAHGMHVTDRGVNGTTVSTNSHSENTFKRCRFDAFTGKASMFWAECTNGLNNSNQDGHLQDCFFASNAAQSGYGVRITRAAGWTIDNNHFYGIGYDAISLDACYATKVTRNYIEDFGGDDGANNGAAPTYGYYSGISMNSVLDTRASTIEGNTVSCIQANAPTGNRWQGISARAGSGQLLANLVIVGNTVVWAQGAAPTTNRTQAFRLGEGGDTGRMLYIEWAGNQIQSALGWQTARYVGPCVTLTEPGSGGGGVPTTRAITTSGTSGLTGGGDLSADRSLAVVYGTTANTAAQGNDSRLSDARTPTAHRTSHQAGGADAPLLVLNALSANTTLTDAHEIVVVDSSGGTRTITLPTAVGRAGKRFTVKKAAGTTPNPVTIASNGGTIDGVTTESISFAGGFRELVSDGTNWQIIGGRPDPVIISGGTITVGGTINIDASVGTVYRYVTQGSATLAVPTNPIDADTINIEISPSANATLTINASILLTTGLSASIPLTFGKRTFLGLRFITGIGWFLLAASSQL